MGTLFLLSQLRNHFRSPMRINKRYSKGRKAISLTSLIDVIFLLLLFFMLTSTFLRYSNFDVASAGGRGTSAAQPPKATLTVHQNKLDLNGEAILMSDLVSSLNIFVTEGETRAVVLVKENVSVERLVKVLDLGRTSTMTSLILAE